MVTHLLPRGEMKLACGFDVMPAYQESPITWHTLKGGREVDVTTTVKAVTCKRCLRAISLNDEPKR
jgi:hypothetical protein